MKWIKVNEQMPDSEAKNTAVLAFICGQQDIIYWCKEDKAWKDYYYKQIVDFSHWMPLPEAPKSE